MTRNDQPIRVLIVDDSPDLVRMIRRWLDNQPDVEVVGELVSVDGLLAAVESQNPAIVLIDLTMPGGSPLDAIREAASRRPEVRAVVMSGYDDEVAIDSAIEAGAWGFISKSASLQEIVNTIRDVRNGRVCVVRS